MARQADGEHSKGHDMSSWLKPAGTPSPAGKINPTLKAVPMMRPNEAINRSK